MTLIGIIISAGVMASISAYMMFKLKETSTDKEDKITDSLQILFFFMVLANFILMGSAGYESRNDCDYLLANSTIVNANITTNAYEYVCTSRIEGAASWVYRLPVWLSYASTGYLVVYLLLVIKSVVKHFNKGGDRG